ncbi:hypothetical protein LTR95_000535 [Oleoguttula sp. CCFEE 5521]
MPNVRFAVGIQRLIPFLGYHHVLMILIAVAIILLCCSSSSPLIPGIFLINFYYDQYTPTYDPTQVDPGVTAAIANIVGQAQLEVRVGYFGLCVNTDGAFLCSNNATALAEQVSIDQDPLNLVWVATTFKDAVVFPYLLIVAIVLAFVTFLLLATFPGWHEEHDARTGSDIDIKPFPSRPVSQVALALIFIASIFVLVSVLWQHTASVAAAQIAQDFGNGSVRSGVGTSAMVLGWFGFGLLVVVTIGLLVMILSIHLLDKLTDE